MLLLDSIFKNIDIGKFVLIHLSDSEWVERGFGYEILDGKQRLSALIEFYENKRKLTSFIETAGIRVEIIPPSPSLFFPSFFLFSFLLVIIFLFFYLTLLYWYTNANLLRSIYNLKVLTKLLALLIFMDIFLSAIP